MTIDDAIHALAARQHGALAVLQASELGATRAMLRHRLAHGRLVQLTNTCSAFPVLQPASAGS